MFQAKSVPKILDEALKGRLNNSHWKIRTAAVDEISQLLVKKIETDPEDVIAESDTLLEFLIQILFD
jgi:hypothetical protein